VARRVVEGLCLRQRLRADAQSIQNVRAVGRQRLVVPDEVVADAARLTQLVVRAPVAVQRPSGPRIDDVQNELAKRHRVALSLVRTIPLFDCGGDPTKVRGASEHTRVRYSDNGK